MYYLSRFQSFAILDSVMVFSIMPVLYLYLIGAITLQLHTEFYVIAIPTYLAIAFVIKQYFGKKGIPKSILG